MENEKDYSLFRSFLQGNRMLCYKWGWHLAQSANLLCSVILTKGFWDCVKVEHTIWWRGLENSFFFRSVFTHKLIFICFNQICFCILFPGNISSLFIILRLVHAATAFLPGLVLFCMCFHVLMWGEKHAVCLWNQHIKWALLRILCASAGGLLCGIAEHLGVGLIHGRRFSSYISVTCYVEVQSAWRGVWSLLDWAHGDVECGDIIKWIHPTGTKKKCSLGVSSCSTLNSLIALCHEGQNVSAQQYSRFSEKLF